MVSRRKAVNGTVALLSGIAASTSLATNLTFNNTRSDGKTYLGFYSNPSDPLSTYGSNVNFGAATTGTTMVVENASNTYTFNYQIGNGWTPDVSMAYSVGPAPAVGVYFTGPASSWPNGAALLGGNFPNDPNDDFYFSFTPAPGYAVRLNSYQLVAGSYDDIRTTATVYENTIGGPTMVPTTGTVGIADGPGNSCTFNLQQSYGSAFYQGTLILDVHQITGNPGDVGLTNLNFDEEYVPSTGEWAVAGSGDWNVASNWGGGVVPNAVGATATLGHVINSAATVYDNSADTVGSLTFNNSNKYVIVGAGSLTLQASSGNASVNVQQGTQEINIPTTLASSTVFNVSTGSTLVIADPLTINSGNTLTTSGGGTVTYESTVTVQTGAAVAFADSIKAQGLSIAAGGVANLTSPAGGGVVEVNNFSNKGTINIGNGELLVDYGSGVDPIASIAAQIKSGYSGGAWNGPGIDTSAPLVVGGLSYGLGYADSADPGNPAGLSSGTLEIKYALLGDADLNGIVNGIDFGILAANFNKGVTGWDQGDFNYQGVVNGIDFAELAANFDRGASGGATAGQFAALDAFAAANGLPTPEFASVPEPASIGLLILTAMGTMGRRRRRVSDQ